VEDNVSETEILATVVIGDITDAEGDGVTVSVSAVLSGADVSADFEIDGGGNITFAAAATPVVGTYVITVSADDGNGKVDQATFNVVVGEESNQVVIPPVVVDPSDTIKDPSGDSTVPTESGDVGIESDILFNDTGIETAVKLYDEKIESTEKVMVAAAEEVKNVLAFGDRKPRSNVTQQLDLNVEYVSDMFQYSVESAMKLQSRIMSMDVFEQLDSDLSNSLNINELHQRFDAVDFSEADINGDGMVDEEEFKKLLKQLEEFKKLIDELEKGESSEVSVRSLLNESSHTLKSAPRDAAAFQTPLQRSLDEMLTFN